MQFKTFIKQCREHDLFKILSIYVVSSWVVLQVLSVTWQPLGFPQKSVTYLIIILLIGLPIYLFFIWKFRIVPLEKERAALSDTEDDDGHKPIKRSFQKYYFIASVFITTLCAFAIFLIIDKNFLEHKPITTISETNKIAVLKFGNNTGDPKYDDVGKMASDWIIHGITENNLGQVISPDVVNQYNKMINGDVNSKLTENDLVKAYLKPSKIITGNYYLKNGKLVFQSTLTDGKTDETIISFKSQDCKDSNPLSCIENLEESITGFLATEDKKKLMLQESPPNYEAYRLVLEAKYEEYDEKYLALINRAIAIDPNYFEAKVLRVAYHYNLEHYSKADSLRKVLHPESNRNSRQVNLLNMYDAGLNGNNKKVYKTNLLEYQKAPYDLASNATTMVIALQYVNKPQEVDSIFFAVKTDSLYIQNCYDCIDRITVKALADLELKKYKETVLFLKNSMQLSTNISLKKIYISALIRSGLNDEVKTLMDKSELTEKSSYFNDLCFYAGLEFMLKDNISLSKFYFEKLIKSNIQEKDIAFANLQIGKFPEAIKMYNTLLKINPANVDLLVGKAISEYKNGNREGATKIIDSLEILRAPYQFGIIDYALGQYYAVVGDESKMYHHLLKAVAAGHLYEPHSFQNDLFLKNYKDTKQFNEIMTFWY